MAFVCVPSHWDNFAFVSSFRDFCRSGIVPGSNRAINKSQILSGGTSSDETRTASFGAEVIFSGNKVTYAQTLVSPLDGKLASSTEQVSHTCKDCHGWHLKCTDFMTLFYSSMYFLSLHSPVTDDLAFSFTGLSWYPRIYLLIPRPWRTPSVPRGSVPRGAIFVEVRDQLQTYKLFAPEHHRWRHVHCVVLLWLRCCVRDKVRKRGKEVREGDLHITTKQTRRIKRQ